MDLPIISQEEVSRIVNELLEVIQTSKEIQGNDNKLEGHKEENELFSFYNVFISEEGKSYFEEINRLMKFVVRKAISIDLLELKSPLIKIPSYFSPDEISQLLNFLKSDLISNQEYKEIITSYLDYISKSTSLIDPNFNLDSYNLSEKELSEIYDRIVETLIEKYRTFCNKIDPSDIIEIENQVLPDIKRLIGIHIFSIYSYTEAYYDERIKDLLIHLLKADRFSEIKLTTDILNFSNPSRKLKAVLESLSIKYKKISELKTLVKELDHFIFLRNLVAHRQPIVDFIKQYRKRTPNIKRPKNLWSNKFERTMEILYEIFLGIFEKIIQSLIPNKSTLNPIKIISRYKEYIKGNNAIQNIKSKIKSFIEIELAPFVELATVVDHLTELVLTLGVIFDRIVEEQLNKWDIYLNEN